MTGPGRAAAPHNGGADSNDLGKSAHPQPYSVAPVDGGGPCDRCGTRSFRHPASGLGWRHEDCEPRSYAVLRAMRLNANGRPTARKARTGCRGCCACKGR